MLCSSCPIAAGSVVKRRDVTPFGFGRPYSLVQLENQLRSARFPDPQRHLSPHLFQPPSLETNFWMKTGRDVGGGWAASSPTAMRGEAS